MGPVPLVAEWLGSLVRELALGGGVLLLASALSFYRGWYRPALSSRVDGTPGREAAESTAHPDDLVLAQAADPPLHLSQRPPGEIADCGGALLFGVSTVVVGLALLATSVVI